MSCNQIAHKIFILVLFLNIIFSIQPYKLSLEDETSFKRNFENTSSNLANSNVIDFREGNESTIFVGTIDGLSIINLDSPENVEYFNFNNVDYILPEGGNPALYTISLTNDYGEFAYNKMDY